MKTIELKIAIVQAVKLCDRVRLNKIGYLEQRIQKFYFDSSKYDWNYLKYIWKRNHMKPQ